MRKVELWSSLPRGPFFVHVVTTTTTAKDCLACHHNIHPPSPSKTKSVICWFLDPSRWIISTNNNGKVKPDLCQLIPSSSSFSFFFFTVVYVGRQNLHFNFQLSRTDLITTNHQQTNYH